MNSNVILMVVVAVLVLALLLWLLANARKTRVEIEPTTPNEQPARRNQALIDAPPVAAAASAPSPVPPVLPVGLPLAGEAVSVPAGVPPVATAPAIARPAAEGDDLTRMKGVGPKVAEQLRALGVTRFAQIAAWDDGEIDRVDAQLGRFQGRIRRDDWVTQARLLAAGDTAGYEAKFGRL